MRYTATHNETGKVERWTEAQVRAEIVKSFQYDMATAMAYSDEEIEKQVAENDISDMFDGDTFEGPDYTIVKS